MKVTKAVSLVLSSLWLFASAPVAARTGSFPASRNDAATLAALIRAPSFQEADKLATKLLADPAIDAQTMAACGLAVLKAGRVAEAEAIFKKAIERSPDSPDAHLGLGRLARIRNDEDGAVAHLRKAVPSASFFEEAYRLASLPSPSWLENNLGQIAGLEGKRLFDLEGSFERLRVPLVDPGPRRFRMVSLKLNGKTEGLFHLDSALAEFMTLSPLLAEELGLSTAGSATSVGVGTASVATRFAVLDKVEFGGVAFRNVPVMVSDVRTLRGLREGLIGTAFLKRFNVAIDVEAGIMDLFPLERPDRLAAGIDRAAVAADVPLYCFDATTVEAAVEGAPPALYILDSAASTNLLDRPFFVDHIKPKLDPARIVRAGIRGAGGEQTVDQVEGLSAKLGPHLVRGLQFNEFPMETLNAIGGR
ncbi:MAG: aspartyl protease family protein, partial [Acidobacteria bacterium]|nr:aspartyl protease family protein [Acidobacteriota bacterium]